MGGGGRARAPSTAILEPPREPAQLPLVAEVLEVPGTWRWRARYASRCLVTSQLPESWTEDQAVSGRLIGLQLEFQVGLRRDHQMFCFLFSQVITLPLGALTESRPGE